MANEALCYLNLLHLRMFSETFHCEGRFTLSEQESKSERFFFDVFVRKNRKQYRSLVHFHSMWMSLILFYFSLPI